MNKKIIIGILALTLTTLGVVFQEAKDSEDYSYLINTYLVYTYLVYIY